MIIRIIGDSWVPEDKVLISVREDNEIKSSLPNIMKKLLIKRISGYKFYHTIGERKCDYGRPIDTHSTWKQIGVSSGSCIYLTKKEPSLKEEPTSTIDLVENKEKDQEVPMNIPTSDEVIDILPSADSVVITEESTHKDLMNHPQEVTRPIYTTTFNSSIQVGLTSQEESVALPVQPCSGKDEGQLPVSTGYQQNTDMTNQNHTSQSNKTLLLQESQHYLKKSGAAGPSYSPEVNYRCSYDSWAKASPIIEKPSTGREKRDLLLRRYERTAYMVSLYEFAHLELERQRRRAGEFLRGAQRGSFCSRTPQPKLLYKI
ncbi:hypothetical protein TCDM_08460 [Trypanosoma cruzi Dm28c]|uniref:Ubiquitin-like domain-containing protein n=1 Tax=Trypanosoma cruzi Dm28c TaxID=1416333 RepID=V5BGS7_TRYCR|nr:hypothetical protein TCDM_08460 [Trypanosoma cruzi Dm28c]